MIWFEFKLVGSVAVLLEVEMLRVCSDDLNMFGLFIHFEGMSSVSSVNSEGVISECERKHLSLYDLGV
jgi:hypothetical protein